MRIKKEIKIIAWDDEALGKKKRIRLVGVVSRGGNCLDGILTTKIERDGLDATEKISNSILKSRQYGQLRIIMLDGITFGGFNIVDIKKLSALTELPVIAVQRTHPNMKKFVGAVKKLDNPKERMEAVKNAGKFYKFENKLFFQCAGISTDDANKVIGLTLKFGNMPNPLRLAHIIASGLSGESRGGV